MPIRDCMRYLKSLPAQLILCVLLSLCFGQYLSEPVIKSIYTASCIVKDVLILVLPVIIFAYIFDALIGLDKKAPLLLAVILVMVFLSNVIGVLISGGIARCVLPLLPLMSTNLSLASTHILNPYFQLSLPPLLSPDAAMFAGIACGFLASFLKIPQAKTVATFLHKVVTLFLHKTFVPLLPIYVTGFVLKLDFEDSLSPLIQSYSQVFVLSLSLIITYIGVVYYVGSGFRFKRFLESVKNMIPAGVTGFSTMSSAATMPVTLEATEKNLKDPRFADLIIPTTANIHLLGDVLAIPLTGLALLWFKTGSFPAIGDYVFFAVMFGIAKFSCAGVPGGGVLVILPVLHKYLGLDQEMITLMTTLYILQDSIFTSSNVMGNGAFAMVVERVCRFFFGNGGDNEDEEPVCEKKSELKRIILEPCVRRVNER